MTKRRSNTWLWLLLPAFAAACDGHPLDELIGELKPGQPHPKETVDVGPTKGDTQPGKKDEPPTRPVELPRASALPECLTQYEGFAFFDPDDGRVSPAIVPPSVLKSVPGGETTLGYDGMHAYQCAQLEGRTGTTVLRWDLKGGKVSDVAADCSALTTFGGQVFFLPQKPGPTRGFFAYGSFDDIGRGTEGHFVKADIAASRLAAWSGELFAAWHSTDHVDVFDTKSGTKRRTVFLEGHNDWIEGLAVRGKELFVVADVRDSYSEGPSRVVKVFDAQSGKLLRVMNPQVPSGSAIGGLACAPGQPAPPAPVVDPGVVIECESGTQSSFVANNNQPLQLNVIGLYEARSDHSFGYHPRGAATVHVSRKGPQILALSSYEPIDWTITLEPGVEIVKLLLNGYETQALTETPKSIASIHAFSGSTSLGSGYDWGQAQTRELTRRIEAEAGAKLTSFNGCYRATRIVVR